MKLTRDAFYLLIIIILIGICGQFYYSYKYIPQYERDIHVFYNKDIEANKKIIETIQQADKFVYFAIYTFTRSDIKDALLGAKHRGLDIRGVTDKDQIAKIEDQEKIIKELKEAGIPIVMQDHSGIMHLKTIVTDKAYVSGSYNWTLAATTINDEVIEVGKDETIRQMYQKIIEKIFNKYSK